MHYLLWFPRHVPHHFFIVWVVWVRWINFNIIGFYSPSFMFYVLCGSTIETHNHIFFCYDFFAFIWGKSKLRLFWLGRVPFSPHWYIRHLYTLGKRRTFDIFFPSYPCLPLFTLCSIRGIIGCSITLPGIVVRLFLISML